MILWGMNGGAWMWGDSLFFLEKPDRSVCCLLTKSHRTWGLLGAAYLWYYQKTEDCAHYVGKLSLTPEVFLESWFLGPWELQKLWLVGTTTRKNLQKRALPKRAVEQFVCFFLLLNINFGVESKDVTKYATVLSSIPPFRLFLYSSYSQCTVYVHVYTTVPEE